MNRKYELTKPKGASIALALYSEKNPTLLSALNSHFETVTTDPDEIESVDVVYFVSSSPMPPLRTIKEMDWIQVLPVESFETPSQKALKDLDWRMIKELESLLPDDNVLRLERDELRSNVDSELS